MAQDAIKQFAKSLHEGDTKQTLSLLKDLRKNRSFRDKWKAKAWDGWISALERGDTSSLLCRITSMNDRELAAVLKDFYDSRRKLAEKDSTIKNLTTGFLGEWIRLIRAYRQVTKKKPDEK